MSDATSGIPTLPTGSWRLSSEITIDAPVDKVWGVLIDFPGYSEWNPFIHSQVMVDARKNRLPDQTAVEGRWLLMDVHFPPFMGFPLRNTAHEQITAVDHEHRRIAWVATPLPRSLLNTVRWQVLTITSDGRTRYENVLMFYGMLGHVVRWVLGKRLKHGFDSTAAALKRRAEST